MKNVLMDTHIWIWFCTEMHDKLSKKALKSIKEASNRWISAISIWELCKLEEKNRIAFSINLLDWITRSLIEYEVSVVHLEPKICVESCNLKNFHQDPADQLIVATSRVLSVPLVSADRRIQEYRGVKTIW